MKTRDSVKVVVTTEELAGLVVDMINAELSPDQPVTPEMICFSGFSGKVTAEIDIQGITFGGFSKEFEETDE
jgi:hypothetical protein